MKRVVEVPLWFLAAMTAVCCASLSMYTILLWLVWMFVKGAK